MRLPVRWWERGELGGTSDLEGEEDRKMGAE